MRVKRILVLMVAMCALILSAAPVAANPSSPCKVGSPGYWSKHPKAWPVDEICVKQAEEYGTGETCYTKEAAIVLMKPDKGDKSITLFRAFVAARLNQLASCDVSCPIPGTDKTIEDIIWQASAWLYDNKPGSGVEANSEAWQNGGEWKYEWLDKYVNGKLCVEARD